jgi:hypothetical protein
VSPIHTNRSENDIENTKITIRLANILAFVGPGAGEKNNSGNYMDQGIQRWDMYNRAKF